MKKIFLAAATLLMGACGPTPNLQGDVSGVDSDTLLVYMSDAFSRQWIRVDTLALDNGHFETQVPDSIMMEISLSAKNKYGEKAPQVIEESFMFLPGDHLTISGDIHASLRAEGTELYDLINQDQQILQIEKELAKAEEELDAADEEDENMEALETAYDEKELEQQRARLEFIKTHPDSRAAAYLSLYLEGQMGLEAIAALSDRVKNGEFKPLIDENEAFCKEQAEVDNNKLKIIPGIAAPDFQLKDMEGKTRSLADFKGKYVVLDFWGTWCGWCLAGIPKMKEYYQKYNNDFEIVGICCADQEAKWRKCVEQRKMNWTNLFNSEEDEVYVTYGVDGYPTKIIIDKEGKIEKVFDGESQEFYDYLDQLFTPSK